MFKGSLGGKMEGRHALTRHLHDRSRAGRAGDESVNDDTTVTIRFIVGEGRVIGTGRWLFFWGTMLTKKVTAAVIKAGEMQGGPAVVVVAH